MIEGQKTTGGQEQQTNEKGLLTARCTYSNQIARNAQCITTTTTDVQIKKINNKTKKELVDEKLMKLK